MKRWTFVTVAAMTIWTGVMMTAQTPMAPADLDKAMKDVGPAMQATAKAIKSGAFADAVPSLATVKQNLVASRRFWVEHKKDDAIKSTDESIAAIDALVAHLRSTNPAPTAVTALEAQRRIDSACRSCHMTYRERDADNNFIIKPGSL